jgi:molybdopterin converting factor small subunit
MINTKAMTVSTQFYAQLREAAGCSRVDIDIAEDATISDLLDKVYAKFPALRAHNKNILVGVGVEFVGRSYKLRPGEEISVMPPVQGG